MVTDANQTVGMGEVGGGGGGGERRQTLSCGEREGYLIYFWRNLTAAENVYNISTVLRKALCDPQCSSVLRRTLLF